MSEIIYLASPYSHYEQEVRLERFNAVCDCAAAFIGQGYFIYSPIAHNHALVKFGLPVSWEFWKKYDENFLEVCSELWVLMLPDWNESVGVQAEIEIMKKLNKPIRFVDSEDGSVHPAPCEEMKY